MILSILTGRISDKGPPQNILVGVAKDWSTDLLNAKHVLLCHGATVLALLCAFLPHVFTITNCANSSLTKQAQPWTEVRAESRWGQGKTLLHHSSKIPAPTSALIFLAGTMWGVGGENGLICYTTWNWASSCAGDPSIWKAVEKCSSAGLKNNNN